MILPKVCNLNIHADDLGLLMPFNKGIREAAIKGFLTSSCVMANGLAFEEAKEYKIPTFTFIWRGLVGFSSGSIWP